MSENGAAFDSKIIDDSFIAVFTALIARVMSKRFIQQWKCSHNRFPIQSLRARRIFQDDLTIFEESREEMEIERGYYQYFFNVTHNIFTVLKNSFRVCATEIHRGLFYFQTFLQRTNSFELTFDSYAPALCACILLGHKMTADAVIKNQFWSDYFGIPLSRLNDLEETIFASLGYNLSISPQEFYAFAQALHSSR